MFYCDGSFFLKKIFIKIFIKVRCAFKKNHNIFNLHVYVVASH